MKKYILPLSLALIAGVTVSAKSKLDGEAKMYISHYKHLLANPNDALPVELPFDVNTKSRAATKATVFVTLADGASAQDVEDQGFFIKAQAGKMVIAEATIDDIEALAESDLVKNIAFGGKAEPTLMRARAYIGTDEIHSGAELGTSYTGAGVICGIYDIGIDVNHPNFLDRDQKASRVKRVWHFPGTNGNFYEYNSVSDIAAFTADRDDSSHGTHTLGCMAGAHHGTSDANNVFTYLDEDGKTTCYNATNVGQNPYYGQAYGADLAVCCGELAENNTTVAVAKMVEYAKSQNKPIVVSLSFGNVIGSHDEYDSFASFVDELGKDAIICIAAGNDGNTNLSVSKTLTAEDLQAKTFIKSTNEVSGSMTIYSNDATPFKLTPVIYNRSTNTIEKVLCELTEPDSKLIYTEGNNGGENIEEFNKTFINSYIQVVTDKNEGTSNRYSARIDYSLTNNGNDNNRKIYVLGIIAEGVEGQHIEMTASTELTRNSKTDWDAPSPDLSISSKACGKNVICVGSFNTNGNSVPVLDVKNNAFTYNTMAFSSIPALGEVSSTSSYGTLSDGRTLPTVCAPGSAIISSVNSYQTEYSEFTNQAYAPSAVCTYNGKQYFWGQMTGTSQATPIVAGAIATWLEANPQLTVEEVRDIIAETAIKDDDTAKGDQVKWGAGKFNAIGGLKKVLGTNGVANIAVDNNNIIVTGNGSNVFNVFVADANAINAQIYNIAGQLVATQSGAGNELGVDAGNLAKGIYVLRVNGKHSQRIVVR